MAVDTARDDGFVRFLEERTDSLLVTAYLLTRDRHRAEDLVQDTLVGLYPKWGRVEGAAAPAAYVRRALVNRFLNQQRRELTAVPLAPGAQYQDDLALLVAEQDQLARALAKLPPRQRAALVVRFHYGLPDAEAAATLGCRVGTLRSLVSRALSALRTDTTLTERADAHDLPGGHR